MHAPHRCISDDWLPQTCSLQRIAQWVHYRVLFIILLTFLPLDNSSVMLIAQFLRRSVFTAVKPPNIGQEFMKVVQSVRTTFQAVSRDMKLNQSLSVLDALVSEPSFPSPYYRLVLNSILDVRCGDIGYLTGSSEQPRFVRLGNILTSEPFISLAQSNYDTEVSVNLRPKDAWSTTVDGENRR